MLLIRKAVLFQIMLILAGIESGTLIVLGD